MTASYSSDGNGYSCSRRTITTVSIFASRRAFNKSKYTLPLHNTTRVTADGLTSSTSSMTLRKLPEASSSSRDTDKG